MLTVVPQLASWSPRAPHSEIRSFDERNSQSTFLWLYWKATRASMFFSVGFRRGLSCSESLSCKLDWFKRSFKRTYSSASHTFSIADQHATVRERLCLDLVKSLNFHRESTFRVIYCMQESHRHQPWVCGSILNSTKLLITVVASIVLHWGKVWCLMVSIVTLTHMWCDGVIQCYIRARHFRFCFLFSSLSHIFVAKASGWCSVRIVINSRPAKGLFVCLLKHYPYLLYFGFVSIFVIYIFKIEMNLVMN